MTTGGTCQSYEYERNAAWHLRATNSKEDAFASIFPGWLVECTEQ